MKLKTYSAQTMAQAMEMAKLELGEEALIVSSVRDSMGSGVKITVAVDESIQEDRQIEHALMGEDLDVRSDKIKEILEYHGIGEVLCERIVRLAEKKTSNSVETSLAAALDSMFKFSPIEVDEKKKVFLVAGAAGEGKSSVVAKLATGAKLAGLNPAVISTDTYRAGANAQMSAITKILDVDFLFAKNPEELEKTIKNTLKTADMVYIDTQSVNPFLEADMIKLNEFIHCCKKPELILAADGGRNTEETVERFCAFAENGFDKLITTKLDVAKRVGGIVAGAYHASMNFYAVSASNSIANSLKSINANLLARLLLPEDFVDEKD